jgi:isoleucyl-tRNA synthetase
VTVFVDEERDSLLNGYTDFLRTLFIVSKAEVRSYPEAPETAFRSEVTDGIAVVVERAEGNKCSRCWNWSVMVGSFADEPEVCERCYNVLHGPC